MKIEVWSDVACPFCYLAERHLELALESFAHGDEVTVIPRSYELDPSAPRGEHRPMYDSLTAKLGTGRKQVESMQKGIADRAREVGLPYDTRNAVMTNTADAHRLVHLARESGLDRQLLRALMEGYFAAGLRAGDHEELTALAVKAGLEESRVREVLGSDRYAEDVRADAARARALGVAAVPFFLFADTYAASGAQSVESFRRLLDEVWAKEHPVQLIGDDAPGAVCTLESCA